jgi:hypothetical protein
MCLCPVDAIVEGPMAEFSIVTNEVIYSSNEERTVFVARVRLPIDLTVWNLLLAKPLTTYECVTSYGS